MSFPSHVSSVYGLPHPHHPSPFSSEHQGGGEGGGGGLIQKILPAVLMNKIIESTSESPPDCHDKGRTIIRRAYPGRDNKKNSRKEKGREQRAEEAEGEGDRISVGRERRKGGGGNGIFQLLVFDMLSRSAPVVGSAIVRFLMQRVRERSGSRAIYNNLVRCAGGQGGEKTGSIFLTQPENDDDGGSSSSKKSGNDTSESNKDMFDAVLSFVSDLPQSKFVHRLPNGRFEIETNDTIDIGDGVYFRRVCGGKHVGDSVSGSGSGSSNHGGPFTVEVFSFDKNVVQLRSLLCEMESKHRAARNNQLGRSLFFFDEIVQTSDEYGRAGFRSNANNTSAKCISLGGGGGGSVPDLSMLPKHPTFAMYPLQTSKMLTTVFGQAMHKVRDRVDFFMNNRQWYQDKGVPYTLGFLLHGDPGCGKTSFIKALAHTTNRHIVNLKLSKFTTTAQLMDLMYSGSIHAVRKGVTQVYEIPIDRMIIVMEDVDCLSDVVLDRSMEVNRMADAQLEKEVLLKSFDLEQFVKIIVKCLKEDKMAEAMEAAYDLDALRVKYSNSNSSPNHGEDPLKLNLSVFLNILDGILETPGRIIVMTSNYPDRLDKALIRPGRIDSIVHFTRCSAEDIAEIIKCIHGVTLSTEQIEALPSHVWTPAQVTQIIFENMGDLSVALARICSPPSSSSSSSAVCPPNTIDTGREDEIEANHGKDKEDDEKKKDEPKQMDRSEQMLTDTCTSPMIEDDKRADHSPGSCTCSLITSSATPWTQTSTAPTPSSSNPSPSSPIPVSASAPSPPDYLCQVTVFDKQPSPQPSLSEYLNTKPVSQPVEAYDPCTTIYGDQPYYHV